MNVKLDRAGKATKALQVVLDDADVKAIDDWRREQPGIPPRGAVIRHFFRLGMMQAGPTPENAHDGA